MNPHISIAIPLHNEEACVSELLSRLESAMEPLPDCEFVFVLDGCTDRTLPLLLEAQKREKRIRVFELSRNFGLSAAVHACLELSRGDVSVIMDGDLQDPPELIPKLVAKLQEGYDVVFVRREARQESLGMRIMFRLFYTIQHRVADIEIPMQAGNYSCLSRKAKDEILGLSEANRFFPGLRSWIGLPSAEVLCDRKARFAGQRKQSFRRLVHYAMDGIYNFSSLPLKFSFFIGVLGLLFGFAMICNVLFQKFVTHEAILGWTSTVICISLFSGAQLVSVGILGSYIKRIYDEVRQRPLYVVRRRWE